MISALLALAIVTAPSIDHTFVYRATESHGNVFLAGTFNGWSNSAMPMERGDDGRTWTKTLSLAPGRHYYKFVLDGETWITDPNNPNSEDDGGGNVNSVLVLLPADYAQPAQIGDGKITLSPLEHAQEIPLLNYDRGRLTVSLRVRPGDVQRVEVVTPQGAAPMTLAGSDDLYALYQTRVPWKPGETLRYSFRLTDGDETIAYGPKGVTETASGNEFELNENTFRPFTPPTWVENSVFYQIFPDRFENGSKANDPKDVEPWDGEPEYYNFFGGDLAGLNKRIGYLSELGIDAIYFNPIFQGPSNHRYEASDYFLIDERLGTNEEFLQTVDDLRSNGIRVVLDGVFNHTAVDFPQFEDILVKGEESRYVDWYFIKDFPVAVKENPPYEAWFGFPSMPKVNLMNPDAREYMLRVGEYWIDRAGIAGWRLDVANEVPMDFWRVFRERVKDADPDAWIVGEVWGDGSPWLKGDQWDSVMNYRFRFPTMAWIAEGTSSPSRYMADLMRVHRDYGPQVSRNMMNLLGSHDTARWMTVCGGDQELAQLGMVMMFTWVGAPTIYYGDELGMEGGADPDNRRGMRWDLANDDNAMLRLVRELTALRRSTPALVYGEPMPLLTDDQNDTLSFARVDEDDFVVVAMNRSSQSRELLIPVGQALELPDGTTLIDRLGGGHAQVKGGALSVELGPKSAAIFLPAARAASSATTRFSTKTALNHRNSS